MSKPSDLSIIRVSGAEWADVRRLFGPAGADNGCWCQYWILGADYHRRDRGGNAEDLRAQANAGEAGLLAYRDGDPVGWARLTPRSHLEYLTDRFRGFDFSDDDPLALACFFVRRDARDGGVMSALIAGAVSEGRQRQRAIEAYPIDATVAGSTKNRFPGILSAFVDAGFEEVGRLSADRAVVRRD